MMSAAHLNTLGLGLDIIGVIMLFKFGLPEHLDRSGNIGLVLEQVDEAGRKKRKDMMACHGLPWSF